MRRYLSMFILVFGVLSLSANSFFKNKKASKGELKGETEIYTAPKFEYRAPFVKVNKPSVIKEEMMLVVSPNLDKDKGPKFKNYRNFRDPIPTIEVEELQFVLL